MGKLFNRETLQICYLILMKIIAHVSKFMTLKIGDLIFTGTPAGVGKVNIGDELIGYLEDEQAFKTKIK